MLNLSKPEANPQEFIKPAADCLVSYVLEMLTAIDIEQLQPTFAHLPADPYLESDYRFRRLSHFSVEGDRLIQQPHRRFFQGKQVNPLLGDVVREYAELEDELVQQEAFQRMVWEFYQFCQVCSPYREIGVHQIRTIASPHKQGNPAPEGIHRDGVDLVGIFAVDRHHIRGAETHLYRSQQEQQPVFSKVLHPGELLIFKDDQYFHYTSPIKATGYGQGTRDVFVLTCPGLFPPEE